MSASENGATNVNEKVLDWPKSKKKFLAVCTKIWYYKFTKSTSSEYYLNFYFYNLRMDHIHT